MTGTILITGATAGIGAASARRFAAAGWKVIATGRRQERIDALVAELGADKVHPVLLDVRDEDAVKAALAALPEPFRGIDILLNNAGLALGTAPAQQGDIAAWRTVIDTNVTAVVVLTHKLLPLGLLDRKGAILNCPRWRRTTPIAAATLYGGHQGLRQPVLARPALRSPRHRRPG
jgi:serine 3-dehydrogenase